MMVTVSTTASATPDTSYRVMATPVGKHVRCLVAHKYRYAWLTSTETTTAHAPLDMSLTPPTTQSAMILTSVRLTTGVVLTSASMSQAPTTVNVQQGYTFMLTTRHARITPLRNPESPRTRMTIVVHQWLQLWEAPWLCCCCSCS